MSDLPDISQIQDRAAAGTDLSTRLTTLTEFARASISAELCVLAWSFGDRNGEARAPRGPTQEDALAKAAIDALAERAGTLPHKPAAQAPDCVSEKMLSRREIAALVGAHQGSTVIWATAFADRESVVRIAIAAASDRRGSEVKALLQVLGRAALAVGSAESLAASRQFWRSRASETGADLARQGGERAESEQRRTAIEQQLGELAKSPRRERLERLGEVARTLGSFDDYIVAMSRDRDLVKAASSREFVDNLATGSGLADCIAQGIAVLHAPDAEDGAAFVEDRIFARPWIALPFDGGALALSSRSGVSERQRAIIEEFAARVGALARAWIAEDKLARYQALVQRASLRMFAAIDEERARISRDLHDDQGQLLAAAMIALQGKRDDARQIFHKLETELRSRTRELRPVSLGTRSLREAIINECERLSEAGIEVRAPKSERIAAISKAVQQLCYQVVREAISNVIRHAHAKHVEIAIDPGDRLVLLTVRDDGSGIERAATRESSGLAGVRERLELMGGRLAIESRPGDTRLIAEIPEPA